MCTITRIAVVSSGLAALKSKFEVFALSVLSLEIPGTCKAIKTFSDFLTLFLVRFLYIPNAFIMLGSLFFFVGKVVC